MTKSSVCYVQSRKDKEKMIVVPKGELAAFYWYDTNRQLLDYEIKAMIRNFPQFELAEVGDGRIMWHGTLKSNRGVLWTLAAIYENNHPNNDDYGGSIKVYAIKPDLNQIIAQYGTIPHTVRDSEGIYYLCTVDPKNFIARRDNRGRVLEASTAVSALGWASKWIFLFESWIHGDISEREFASHDY
ncbi:hypothetical protein FTO70_10640 [Methanosarcina sp. KYL-1]|uniref:hypothetical protein n=1 Tax=Methanosarcina sp. KYL-1 TaxID=2602068 RepID=UPI0021016DB4|nr:hypothetical protein [Methanosarcina sp. KYL-1]MCQ1536128.1 hypothetical protein [Methanosarcina sp. KYL-1]